MILGGGLLLEDRGIDDMTTPALESTKTIKSIAKARGVEGFQLGRSGRIITFIFPSLDQWFLKALSLPHRVSLSGFLKARAPAPSCSRFYIFVFLLLFRIFLVLEQFYSFWNNFIPFGIFKSFEPF